MDIKHGIYSSYTNKGCRCDECRSAAREYVQRNKKPSTPMTRAPKPITHGTGGYQRGCKCDICRAAVNEYQKSRRNGLPEGDNRHGTQNGYQNFGCRCTACRKAVADYNRESGAARKAALKKNYGITPEQWDVMFEGQGKRCASCGDERKPDSKRRFHVDHNHTTGVVRGILCHSCNVALGHLKEDKERIRALIDYIEAYEPF